MQDTRDAFTLARTPLPVIRPRLPFVNKESENAAKRQASLPLSSGLSARLSARLSAPWADMAGSPIPQAEGYRL